MTKTVNSEVLKWVTSLEKGSHSQEQNSRRGCLEVVGIPSSGDGKNLQSTVCSILDDIDVDIDVVAESNDIEDCCRIKEHRVIIKFSSRRKSSKVLNKEKKLTNLNIRKYGLNYGENVKVFGKTSFLVYYQWSLGSKKN